MRLQPIVDRISDQVPVMRLVGGAADAARAEKGLTTFPAAFVLPAHEQAGENPFMDQTVQQRLDLEFAVMIAVRNLSDDEGAAAADTLDGVRTSIRTALLGWVPTGAEDNCEFVSGDLAHFANGVLWWQDNYRTAYTIRSS